ncbi:unnamed protein product [Durusdinium trenchii]|uniref:Uncharacterized protein n=2 Tax=Durusdinium trenchii TaxID=1381693 RepID=A0ABP0RGD6_9DINO
MARVDSAHLWANFFHVLEEQLQALRAEHEILKDEASALRRCLDKSGVLPSADLEEELRQVRGASHRRPSSKEETTSKKSSETEKSPQAPPNTSRLRGPRGAAGPAGPAPPPENQSDLPSVPLHVEDVRAGPDTGKWATEEMEVRDFQSTFQAVLEDQSPSRSQVALRSLQSLLRSDPSAHAFYQDPSMPGGSALSAAVRGQKIEAVKILLKAKADPTDRDDKGVSALHLASFDGNLELAKVLILARAKVDACDRHGQTALFFAPSKEMCKLLIERNSDVNVLNRRGQSALHMAGMAGLHELLAWLSSRVSQTLSELKDIHGIDARCYAKRSGVPVPKRVRTPSPSRTPKGRTPRSPTKSLKDSKSRSMASLGSLGSVRSDRSGKNSPGPSSGGAGSARNFEFFQVVDRPTATAQTPPSVLPEPLPFVSSLEFPLGSPMSTATSPGSVATPTVDPLESMYAGLSSLEKRQKMRGRSQTLDRDLAAVVHPAVGSEEKELGGKNGFTQGLESSDGLNFNDAKREKPKDQKDLAAAGVLHSDFAAAGVLDPDLAAAGVLDDDLAAAGVLDDNLAAAGVLDPDLAADGVLDDDLAAAGVLDPDLAADGVLDDDLAAAGVLDPDLAADGVLDQEYAGTVLQSNIAPLEEELDECF